MELLRLISSVFHTGFALIAVTGITCCQDSSIPHALRQTIRYNNPNPTVVALQPLSGFNRPSLDSIATALHDYYGFTVRILNTAPIPRQFYNATKSPRYSADSLLIYLLRLKPDSCTLIIGVTEKDIFTTKRDSSGNIKYPPAKYAVWGIFGLGYMPGASCVVSGFRLRTPDHASYIRRLRNVVLHEVGHNLGLPHCANTHCFMTDANETITTIDNESSELCAKCKALIGLR